MSRQIVRTEQTDEEHGMRDLAVDEGDVRQQEKAIHHQQQHHQQQDQYMHNTAGSQQAERSWDVQKILHLYIYDYCLKHNNIKAANALAEETGIRTDEGVPFAADSVDGLLLDWFTTFWRNFAGSSMPATQSQSEFQLKQVQHRSAFASASPIRSTLMRRTETEPIMKSPVAAQLASANLPPVHRSTSQGHHPTPQYSPDVDMSAPVGPQQTSAVPPSAGRTSRDIACDAMQKMGWGDRRIDTLSGDEKSKLVTVLKRSQLAQHQALQRMAVTHQNTSLEASANRGPNGSVFQQERSSMGLAVQQQNRHQPGSADLMIVSQQLNTTAKKAAQGSANQHKKQRKSVNLSSMSKIQQLQRQQPASKKEQINISMPMGISNALEMGLEPSPSIEAHHASAPKSTSQSRQMYPSAMIETAHQAQSQVASQMTMQLDAQIAQMQNQMHQGSAKKINSEQISKLQALQGKLQHQQQQQQNQHSRSFSDMGPPPPNPPTPALISTNSFQSDQMTPEWGQQPVTPFDQYGAMQQQQLHPSASKNGKADATFNDIDFNNFDWSSLDTSSVL